MFTTSFKRFRRAVVALMALMVAMIFVDNAHGLLAQCNFGQQQCNDESDYQTIRWHADCYEDPSRGDENRPILACVDTCDEQEGDLLKCEDFCLDFVYKGECQVTVSEEAPTSADSVDNTQTTTDFKSPISRMKREHFALALIAVATLAVAFVATTVILIVCYLRKTRQMNNNAGLIVADNYNTGMPVHNASSYYCGSSGFASSATISSGLAGNPSAIERLWIANQHSQPQHDMLYMSERQKSLLEE